MAWQIKRGTQPSRAFNVTDANGDPVDLTAMDVTVIAHISRIGYAAAVVLTAGDGIDVSEDGVNGNGVLTVSAVRTNSLAPDKRHPWTLEIQVTVAGVPLVPIEEDVIVVDSSFGTLLGS